MPAPIVVFDLDGTLVDTAPDLVATLNWVLDGIGLPGVPYAEARYLVGGGARKMIERALSAERRNLPAAEIDRLIQGFIAHYANHIADRSRPFEGLEAALDQLSQCGCRLAVCTNKLEWLSRRLLDALGLATRFVVICGADTFGVQKPHPELLRATLSLAGERVENAIMVGDSVNDVAMAKSLGVWVIAVDYGYSETPVVQLGADRVISDLSELPGAVFELAAAPARAT
ncbi:MAG TPA: HAD family hydrolase [Xanthobacteraceae bacterium]